MIFTLKRLLRTSACIIAALTMTVHLDAQVGIKVAPEVDLSAERPQEVILVLEQRVIDTRGMGLNKTEKGTYVFNALRTHARQSQREVVDALESWNTPYKSFFIGNAILTWLDAEQITAASEFNAVERIILNPDVFMEEPEPGHDLQLRSGIPEFGLQLIGADSVWSLGIRGDGAVVGGADTGYEWDHPALIRQYRGWNGDSAVHSYNWHDAIYELSPLHGDSTIDESHNICGLDIVAPCDDHGHGTHTMGTMIGLDDDNVIGVAPEARWIGCRNMERGYGSPMSYLECFEWFLAPTDTASANPDPSLAPHVINNSWSCPSFEGCSPDVFPVIQTAIANLRMAGVVVVASAGNSGFNGCGSVSTPPAIFAESFTVGATNFADTIAGFSSRGPVEADSSMRVKPDVVAPGVSIRSAWVSSRYKHLNGTSMAGPHVAGAVALMISANPDLAGEVDLIEQILRETAVPLSTSQVCDSVPASATPNNTYGHGRIDVFAAVQAAMEVTDVSDPERADTEFLLFPNPARERLTVTSRSHSVFDIAITSMDGRLVKAFTDHINGNTLSLQGIPGGIYAVTLLNSDTGEILQAEKLVVSER